MAVAEIFISHSAKANTDLAALLEAVHEALTDAGLEVFLDRKRLRGAFSWRAEIDQALLRCHGAVVVVAEGTLRSRWVGKETTLLTARKRVSPTFPLLPLIVPPMTPERLRRSRSLEPVRLEDYQGVVQGDMGAAAAAVVEVMKPLIRRFSITSPQVLEEVRIARMLRTLEREVLQAAGKHVGLEPQQWALDDEPARLLARRLLESRIEALHPAVETIRYIDPDVAAEVFEAVAPFTWVNWQAAAEIAEVAAAPQPPRAVGVNSTQTLTCRMYVRCGAPTVRIGEVTGGFSEEMADEFGRHVRITLNELFRQPPGALLEDGVLKLYLQQVKVVMIVPHPPPEDAVLAEVKRTFPELTLFFAAGTEAAAELEARGLGYVRLLAPELVPDEETAALAHYRMGQGIYGPAG